MFDLCKFFQIHTRKGKRRFHLHPRLTIHLSISESVIFLGCSKDPLDCFFSVGIQILHSLGISYVIAFFHVVFPYMSGYQLYMVLAECALFKVWTAFTCCSTALVLPVSITISCRILQYLIVRTYVTVIVFIVSIITFLKEAFLGHRSLVWKEWCYAIIYEHLYNCRCFVACISNDSLNTDILYLVIQTFERTAVMLVSWIDREIKYPTILITGSFDAICEYTFA